MIELLVVIAIIGMLAAIVLVSLNSTRSKARDARRKMDLKQIQTALEMYYDKYNHYPKSNTWQYSSQAQPWIRCITCDGPGENANSMLEFMPSISVDPTNNANGPWTTGNYTYAYGDNVATYGGQKYDLVAQLENTGDVDRCALKCWKYHTGGGEAPWCSACTGGYTFSPYLYADH